MSILNFFKKKQSTPVVSQPTDDLRSTSSTIYKRSEHIVDKSSVLVNKENQPTEQSVATKTPPARAKPDTATQNPPRQGVFHKAIIVRPLLSEKSVALEASRRYTFAVLESAKRKEIKAFVEQYYSVKVRQVNIVRVKERIRGKSKFKNIRPHHKKAIIALKAGYEIKIAK